MNVGVLAEADPDERRVAATPSTVAQLIKLGYAVTVAAGAGAKASFADTAYESVGATIGDPTTAEVILGVNAPTPDQLDQLRPGATVVALLAPALRPDLVDDLAHRPLTALAMDAVPRISRAQSLDVLSSMANIAGNRAVIEAAHAFGRLFTGQVTAAGKMPPAKVLVVGAGVAGLAAIGAAGAMGAVVRATDPRPEVADQVKSLGGEYVPVAPDAAQEQPGTGYATEMGDTYKARESELYARLCQDVDIIITTALIPGRPAPRLLTAAMVESMKSGSVIVDMAASNGGNVEGTVAGRELLTPTGVTIIGYTDLAGRLPAQASQLYGTNIVNLLKLMTPAQDGHLVVDFDDVVVRSMTVVRDGTLTWPAPPVQVSATPPPSPAASSTPARSATVGPRRDIGVVVAVAAAILFAAMSFAPAALLGHLTVFALAIVIGYYVIGHVHHALHTPLMSVTNAISGIIVTGAVLQVGHLSAPHGPVITALSAAAILLASINIVGGFAVTRRMLAMFARS